MQNLSSKEAACLIARIGWLKIFNPMKPEGSYALDLSRWEERMMAKSLCALVSGPNYDLILQSINQSINQISL